MKRAKQRPWHQPKTHWNSDQWIEFLFFADARYGWDLPRITIGNYFRRHKQRDALNGPASL